MVYMEPCLKLFDIVGGCVFQSEGNAKDKNKPFWAYV